jgi:hypothetical protein
MARTKQTTRKQPTVQAPLLLPVASIKKKKKIRRSTIGLRAPKFR